MTQNQIGFTLTKTGGQWIADVDNLPIPAELSRWIDASFYGRRLELVVVLTPAGALAGVWVNRVALPACPRRVSLVSPDFSGTKTPATTCAAGKLTVTVDRLDYSAVLALS